MKKLLFVMVAFAAISFASCGSKTANDSVNDSTVVTDSDSVSTDSDSIVTDSAAAFAADSITAAE